MAGPHLLTYKGKTQSICAWGRELGMCASVISRRLKHGCSIKRALDPVKWCRPKYITVEYQGRRCSIAELKAMTTLSYNAVYRRIKKGMTPEETLQKPYRYSSLVQVMYKGSRMTCKELSQVNGVPARIIRQRLGDGWAVERAVSESVGAAYGTKLLTRKGETHSLYGWAKKLGIRYSTLSMRFHAGMSVEDILRKGRVHRV